MSFNFLFMSFFVILRISLILFFSNHSNLFLLNNESFLNFFIIILFCSTNITRFQMKLHGLKTHGIFCLRIPRSEILLARQCFSGGPVPSLFGTGCRMKLYPDNNRDYIVYLKILERNPARRPFTIVFMNVVFWLQDKLFRFFIECYFYIFFYLPYLTTICNNG